MTETAAEGIVLGKESYPAVLTGLAQIKAEAKSGRNYCDVELWIQMRDASFKLTVTDVVALTWAIASEGGSKLTYEEVGRMLRPSAILTLRSILVRAYVRDFAEVDEDSTVPFTPARKRGTHARGSSSGSARKSTAA